MVVLRSCHSGLRPPFFTSLRTTIHHSPPEALHFATVTEVRQLGRQHRLLSPSLPRDFTLDTLYIEFDAVQECIAGDSIFRDLFLAGIVLDRTFPDRRAAVDD